jgi:large subunit ribosomal protein L4
VTTTIDVLNAKGKKAGSLDLPAEIFDVQVNIPLIHQVVVAQQAAARQGSAKTKTRGEVAGGGRKPYRQKGTGRARQGSIRAPQFAGGGVVHGPAPRSYDQRTPKKMKAAALRGALSDRARDGRVHVVEALIQGETPSTKSAVEALAKITQRPRSLVVVDRHDDVTWLSLRNVDTVHLLSVDQLNTYDVLVSDDVVFVKGAYESFTGMSVTIAAVEDDSDDAADEPAEKPAKKTAAKKTAAKKAVEPETVESDEAGSDEAEPDQAADEKPAKKTAAKKAVESETVESDETEPDQAESDRAADEKPAKKTAAKKTVAKKTAAKKTAAKKTAAKKTAAKKTADKDEKSADGDEPAEKPAKKAAAKKTAAKKTVAKKTAAKKAADDDGEEAK